MSTLVSLDEVKQRIGIDLDNTEFDGSLRSIISGTSALFEDATGCIVTAATYTEKFDIYTEYTDRVILKHNPVISVAAVTDYGSLVDSDNYAVKEEGAIVLCCGYYFTDEIEAVEVTYYAGHTTVPWGIKDLVLRMIDAVISRRGKEGLKSLKLGDLSVTLAPDLLASFTRELQLYQGRIF